MAASTACASSTSTKIHQRNPSVLPKPYSSSSTSSQLPFNSRNFTAPAIKTSVSCALTREPAAAAAADAAPEMQEETAPLLSLPRPDSFGRFGNYGGKYVPETLMHALTELESAFHALAGDHEFQVIF